MRGPLAVHIDDGAVSRHVTSRTRGLRFKRSAFGGDVDLSCQVRVPRGTFTDLGPGDSVVLYDGRTGETVWSGNTDNPGALAGRGGEAYDLQAFGAAARLQASARPLAYVLSTDEGWGRSRNSTRGAQTTTGERAADDKATLEVEWNKGFDVDQFDLGEWVNRSFQSAGLRLARVAVNVDAGFDSPNWTQRIVTGADSASLSPANSRNANVAAGSLVATLGAGIALGDDVVGLRAMRTGTGAATADKTTWFRFWDATLSQVLKDVTGANITTGYGSSTVRADEVVADMVGRGMAPGIDPAKAVIPRTEYGIDALAHLDGITFGDMMRQLLVFEPHLYWMAASDTLTVGLWDHANPRYVVSRRDGGVTHPGEEFTLCNRVLVSWVDRKGRDRTTEVTSTVDGLDYTRDAEPVTLPDGVGSEANAQRAGERALALTNNPPRAGTAVVRRKIFDRWAGMEVWPHEIQPGCVVLEQETGDDLRLTEVEYIDADSTAVLTLGEPVRTIEQTLARLHARRRRRRNR